MSHPHAQELSPSARFARAEDEATSRMASIKLAQEEAAEASTSTSSVSSPGTPPARARKPAASLPGVRPDITAVVGQTPCIRLSARTTEGCCAAAVVAKLESSEPCCSVKDRCGTSLQHLL